MRFRIRKSDVNNSGIRVKLTFGRDCFLVPYLKIEKFPFFRPTYNPYNKVKYELVTQKIFCWLWFRLVLKIESIGAEVVSDVPIVERAYNMLPPKINVVGVVYKLNIVKEDLTKICYLNEDKTLFGEVSSCDLKDALIQTVMVLKETDNVRFMRYEYRKLYEESFNIEIPVERKFELYYE